MAARRKRSGPLWAVAVVGGGLVMLLGVWGTYSACFLPWHCPSQGCGSTPQQACEGSSLFLIGASAATVLGIAGARWWDRRRAQRRDSVALPAGLAWVGAALALLAIIVVAILLLGFLA